MKKLIYTLVIISLLPTFAHAEIFAKVGTKGLQFLKLGIDGRAMGMASAYTAVSDDISSVYWNPAGLALKESDQVMFSHTNYVADIKHEYVAYSRYGTLGSYSIHASYLWMDNMDVTSEATFGATGEEFTASDLAVGFTFAKQLTSNFSFGFTGKYLREKLADYDVNGYSVDVGSLYNTGFKNLTVGMALRNFGPDLIYEVDNDGDGQVDEDVFDQLDNDNDGLIDEDREESSFGIPMSFSLGVSMEPYVNEARNEKLIVSIQIDNVVDREEAYSLGAEYKISNFFLRGGKYFNYDAHNYALGFGVLVPTSIGIFNVDLSYTDYQELQESALKTPLRFSVKMAF